MFNFIKHEPLPNSVVVIIIRISLDFRSVASKQSGKMEFVALCFVICSILVDSMVYAFRTGSCNHYELESSLEHFEACFLQTGKVDICSSFNQLDICFPRHFGKCFETEVVDEITETAKSVLRKAMEMILEDQQHHFGGFNTASLFDTCPNMPSHEQAEKAESRLIIWLDHANTDKDCNQEDKDKANFDSYQCLDKEKQRIETQLRKVFARQSNLQEKICSVLAQTVGVCMETKLPACFSEREIAFIKKNMAEDFKEIFTAMEDLLGSYDHFSVSECAVWSEDNLFTQESSASSVQGQFLLQVVGVILLGWVKIESYV